MSRDPIQSCPAQRSLLQENSLLNILILGGTHFVGRHIAEALVAAGHSVSVLNRRKSPDELPALIERLRGDRDKGAAGLESLKGRTWDACVDVSGYTPRQVRPSAKLLHGKIQRYIYISAVSVYGDPQSSPVTETFRRLPPASEDVTEINAETYGPLKVACENIIKEIYGDKATLLRPQIVAGPYDPIVRLAYWVRRATEPGEMLAPGDGTDHVPFIDARDLARFTVTVIENDLGGSYNLAGPRLTWAELMDVLEARNLVWVPSPILKAAGLNEQELPLYRRDGGPRSRLMHVSNERAVAAGLTLSAPDVTVNDIRTWLETQNVSQALSPQMEAELICQFTPVAD